MKICLSATSVLLERSLMKASTHPWSVSLYRLRVYACLRSELNIREKSLSTSLSVTLKQFNEVQLYSNGIENKQLKRTLLIGPHSVVQFGCAVSLCF